MINMSDIPKEFTADYYNQSYFADKIGKKYRKADGSDDYFGYKNEHGEWLGCKPICEAWKTLFNPRNILDVGAGRGTFITYCRDVGIRAEGLDYSDWAVSHPYVRCHKDWLKKHDCTQPLPYSDNSFDMVTVLDFFEHIYEQDTDKIIKEVYRVSNRFVFLLIATVGGGAGVNLTVHDKGYILKRGETIPIELECFAAAGHCTVCGREWWEERLLKSENVGRMKFNIRCDLEAEFRRLVPKDVLANWKTIIILEKDI